MIHPTLITNKELNLNTTFFNDLKQLPDWVQGHASFWQWISLKQYQIWQYYDKLPHLYEHLPSHCWHAAVGFVEWDLTLADPAMQSPFHADICVWPSCQTHIYKCAISSAHYTPAPIAGALSNDARLTSLYLTSAWHFSCTSDLSREQRGLGRLKLAQRWPTLHVT